MRKRNLANALVLVALAGLLAGCGGSGSAGPPPPPPPPEPVSGVFGGGPIVGLRYRTATQAGLTDAQGKFLYLPGETITFSIGGVQLGSIAGAPDVNLFTLVGYEPPRTEVELRKELLTPNDVTDFDRVANRALLLVALDNDRNAANGVDLTGWDSKLADATLSFEHPMLTFTLASTPQEIFGAPFDEFESFARRHGLNREVPVFVPLVQLYRALGIAVRAQARQFVSDDRGNDGSIDAIETFDYDSEFRENYRAFNLNGNEHNELVIDRRFGSNSRLESLRMELYDDRDGSLQNVGTATFEYDDAGKLIGRVEDRVDAIVRVVLTYDSAGNVLTEVAEEDEGSNGSIDSRRSVTSVFDEQNNELSRIEENDGASTTKTSTFDTRGNVLTSFLELDPESSVRETHSYDASGNRTTSRQEERSRGGTSITDSVFAYESGRPVKYVVTETDADGDVTFLEQLEQILDDRGNVIRENVHTDGDGDGSDAVDRTSTSFTYDDVGNLVRVFSELDRGNDGNVDEGFEVLFSFSSNLAPLSRVERSDDEGDFDLTNSTATSYLELNDGLEALIREYGEPPLQLN